MQCVAKAALISSQICLCWQDASCLSQQSHSTMAVWHSWLLLPLLLWSKGPLLTIQFLLELLASGGGKWQRLGNVFSTLLAAEEALKKKHSFADVKLWLGYFVSVNFFFFIHAWSPSRPSLLGIHRKWVAGGVSVPYENMSIVWCLLFQQVVLIQWVVPHECGRADWVRSGSADLTYLKMLKQFVGVFHDQV